MMEPHKVAAPTLKAKVHKVSELAINKYDVAFKKKAAAIDQYKTVEVSPKNLFTNNGPNIAPSPRAE